MITRERNQLVDWIKTEAEFGYNEGSIKSQSKVVVTCPQCRRDRVIQYQNVKDNFCKSCTHKNEWDDPDYRERRMIQMRSEEYREKQSIITTNGYIDDPDRRRSVGLSTQKRWNDPDYREKLSITHQKRYEDPEERRKTGVASVRNMKELLNDPKRKSKWLAGISARAIERYEDPKARLKSSIAAIKKYEDPMEHIKTSAALQGISVDDWEDFLYNQEDSRISPEYSDWRQSVYRRDYHTCQMCNTDEGIIHAHHILPVRDYPELLLDQENGITLCKKCHEKTYGCEEGWADTFIMLIN